MRTRHILFTMVLGATLAACTSEEDFKVAGNGNASGTDLTIRPVVGSEIVLDGDEAATRLALGTGARPVWGANDKLGAAIIDKADYASEEAYWTQLNDPNNRKPVELYKIIESYGCNNAFTTTNGGATWSAEHPMVEGNYLFYAPYQEGLSLRSPLKVRVPKQQNASTEKSALDEFYNSGNVVQVGYKFISGDERQSPSVGLFNIFAYPKFTVTNTTGSIYRFDRNEAGATSTQINAASTEIRIDSIQFVNVNASKAVKTDFVLGGILKHADAETKTAKTATAGVVYQMREKENVYSDEDGAWKNLDLLLNQAVTADLLSDANQIKSEDANSPSMNGVITTLEVEKTLGSSTLSVPLYCVMPSARFNFDNNQLMARIYVTIDGRGYVLSNEKLNDQKQLTAKVTAPGYVFGAGNNIGLNSLSLMAGQSLPAEAIRVVRDEQGNEDYAKKTDVSDMLAIDFSGLSAIPLTALNPGIQTTQELIEMIQNAANGTDWAEGNDDAVANTKGFQFAVGHTVEINSALINALAGDNQNSGKFKLNETVLPISSDVKVTDATDTGITFESASGKTFTIDLAAGIVETSTNTTAEKYAIADGSKMTAVTTPNEGTVVIAKAGTSTLTVTDGLEIKSVQVLEGAELTLSGAYALTVSGAVRNEGTLNIANVITCKNIVNNGTISATTNAAAFTVTGGEGTITIAEANPAGGVKVASGVAQDVVLITTSTLSESAVTTADGIASINAIQVTTSTTDISVDLWTKFGHVKHVILPDNVDLTLAVGAHNMAGFTITVKGTSDLGSAGTMYNTGVTGINLELDDNATLNLNNVAVSGTATKGENAKIKANGTSATWNGGSSDQD